MNKFEDFLSEGKKIQIKRKYTENHPASTVGKTAGVRNEILKAVKDGVITEEEFTRILSELSGDHKQWRTRNTKYFNVSEDGVRLSKWGLRILAELDEQPKAVSIHEATVVMDAIDPKSRTLKKLLKKYNVKMKILTMNGPGGGNPEVEMTGSREDLQAILADPNGWDDPELGEYIEEKISENFKILKDKWPYIEVKSKGKKYEIEFDDYDVIDDHGNEGKDLYFMGTDQNGDMWEIDVYADYRDEVQDIHYDTLVQVDESKVNEKDDAGDHLDKLAELVGKAKDFMSVGKELKAGKYKYDFGTGMMPHYQVEADGFTFMILNKRYVDKGDREVNGIAIGLLENIKTEITNMENTFSLYESFAAFTGANGFLNERLGSQILAIFSLSDKA